MVIFYKMPKTTIAKYLKREMVKIKYKMLMSLRKVRPVVLRLAYKISTDILSSSINLLGEIWKQIEVNKVPILYLVPRLKIKACCSSCQSSELPN